MNYSRNSLDACLSIVILSLALLGACAGGTANTGTQPQPERQPSVLGQPVQVPDGVDPALMAQLAETLEQQLLEQGGRAVSDVTGVYVDPLARNDDGMNAVLSWAYNNTGDYDQNGEANIADLTPIGINFGATSADPGWAAAQVADGDRNGEVNIADVTPIGMNFGSVVANYVVEANIDGAGDWRPVANVPFSAGVIPTGGGIMQFTGTVPNGTQAPGAGADVFRVFAGPVAGPLYQFPDLGWSAMMAIYPMSGYAPMETSCAIYFFTDTGPFDVDIDFDDATPHYVDTSPDGTTLEFDHTFATTGTYNVSGTVTNTGPLGGELSIGKQIQVVTFSPDHVTTAENWAEIEMQDGEFWGRHSAIALVNGMPVIVYTRDDREEIYFARSTVARPTIVENWRQMVIDDDENRGGTLGVCEVQGVPCVVYEDTDGQDTYFASATSATPSTPADWAIHQVDTPTPTCEETQIADVGGVPGLVYITGGGVRYAESNVGLADLPEDANDWDYHDVDTNGFMAFPQIQAPGGSPVIAYQRAESGWKELRYAWRNGGTWQIYTVDDLDKNSGNTVKMVLVNDVPLIAYQNVDIVSYLRLSQFTTATPDGSDDWTSITVRQEEQTHVGNWLGLGWFNGRPFMSYVNTGSGSTAGLQISIANPLTPLGPEDFDHAILDPADTYFVNEQTSVLVMDDSTLFIAYRTSEGFKFAYFTGP